MTPMPACNASGKKPQLYMLAAMVNHESETLGNKMNKLKFCKNLIQRIWLLMERTYLKFKVKGQYKIMPKKK